MRGRLGEQRAARSLEREGYRVVSRNFRCRRGEIDLVIVREQTIAFVEVKTWEAFDSSSLEWAVGPRKQKRIIGASRVFLARYPVYSDYYVRYDLVFVSDGMRSIEHLEDAFVA